MDVFPALSGQPLTQPVQCRPGDTLGHTVDTPAVFGGHDSRLRIAGDIAQSTVAAHAMVEEVPGRRDRFGQSQEVVHPLGAFLDPLGRLRGIGRPVRGSVPDAPDGRCQGDDREDAHDRNDRPKTASRPTPALRTRVGTAAARFPSGARPVHVVPLLGN